MRIENKNAYYHFCGGEMIATHHKHPPRHTAVLQMSRGLGALAHAQLRVRGDGVRAPTILFPQCFVVGVAGRGFTVVDVEGGYDEEGDGALVLPTATPTPRLHVICNVGKLCKHCRVPALKVLPQHMLAFFVLQHNASSSVYVASLDVQLDDYDEFVERGAGTLSHPLFAPDTPDLFSVDVTADAQRMVTGDVDGGVRLYRLHYDDARCPERAELLAVLNASFGYINAVAFCPGNENVIASAHSSSVVALWLFDQQRLLGTAVDAEDTLFNYWALSWSRDGRRLAAAPCVGNCGALVFDTSSCVERDQLPQHEFPIVARCLGAGCNSYAVAFSPDDTVVATGSGVRQWNAATGECVRAELDTHAEHGVFGVCWSPDGRYFASCGNDGCLVVRTLKGTYVIGWW